MRVVFDDDALEDIRHIFEWIAKDNPRAADELAPAYSTGLSDLRHPNYPKWEGTGWWKALESWSKDLTLSSIEHSKMARLSS